MSRKSSNYKRSTLGQVIRGIHKHSPKTMAEDQKKSKNNAKKTVLQVKWTGRRNFITQ